jgi:hypothetical protein
LLIAQLNPSTSLHLFDRLSDQSMTTTARSV